MICCYLLVLYQEIFSEDDIIKDCVVLLLRSIPPRDPNQLRRSEPEISGQIEEDEEPHLRHLLLLLLLLFSSLLNSTWNIVFMSSSPSTPTADLQVVRKKPRQIPRRQPLSCLPCRLHKLRCDRQIPCSTCTRYSREDVCLENPAPAKSRPRVSTTSRTPHATSTKVQRLAERAAAAPDSSNLSGSGNRSLNHQLVDNVHMVSAAEAMSLSRAPAVSNELSPDLRANSDQGVLFPQLLPLLQFSTLDGSNLLNTITLGDHKIQWKRVLVKLVPTRTQSDILLSYFIEHINWLFQTVHIPTFRREYALFWDGKIEEVNLIWMSLLFTIISLSALYIPVDAVELVGLEKDKIRKYAHIWHHASLQALQAGDYESKPTLTQLQTFSITQLYWYATNNIEILNSYDPSHLRIGLLFSNSSTAGWDRLFEMLRL